MLLAGGAAAGAAAAAAADEDAPPSPGPPGAAVLALLLLLLLLLLLALLLLPGAAAPPPPPPPPPPPSALSGPHVRVATYFLRPSSSSASSMEKLTVLPSRVTMSRSKVRPATAPPRPMLTLRTSACGTHSSGRKPKTKARRSGKSTPSATLW